MTIKGEGKTKTSSGSVFGVDKVQIGSDKVIATEFSLSEVAPGTKLTAKFTDGSREAGAGKISASVGVEYKTAKVRNLANNKLTEIL